MIDPELSYENLMNLCEEFPDSFFYRDSNHSETGQFLRTFSYHIMNNKHLREKSTRWCRGTVYLVNKHGTVLLSRCMPKFFNLNEGDHAPSTEDLHPRNIDQVFEKRDGSLITLFYIPDEYIDLIGDAESILVPGTNIAVKSKTSFTSAQANEAREFLREKVREKNIPWIITIGSLTKRQMSMNFEWTSPRNRIVVDYKKDDLRFLNSVNHVTGGVSTWPPSEKISAAKVMTEYVLPDNLEKFKDQTDEEGVVVYFKDGEICKLKNQWYLSLHRVIPHIKDNAKITEAYFNEVTDDIKPMVDREDRERIERIEEWAHGIYSNFLSNVEKKYRKCLECSSMKESALLAQELLKEEIEWARQLSFHIIMHKLREKPFDKLLKRLEERIVEIAKEGQDEEYGMLPNVR